MRNSLVKREAETAAPKDWRALGGDSMGPGWFYCSDCQDKFTVRMGSIMPNAGWAMIRGRVP